MLGADPNKIETAIQEELVSRLQDLHWGVASHPVFGLTRPDFFVDDANGKRYIIEVKMGSRGAHLGSVAQTAAFREAAAAQLQHNVGAILVLAGGDAQELQSTGDDYGVQVIGTSSAEPQQVVEAIVSSLTVARDHATNV